MRTQKAAKVTLDRELMTLKGSGITEKG